MVTKRKDNLSYIKYIRKEMKVNFPEWIESGDAAYDKQINNNFQVDFEYKKNKISFVKDRGLLEIRVFIDNKQVGLGHSMYDLILNYIPDQDPKWRLSLCVELIDYYIDFLKKNQSDLNIQEMCDVSMKNLTEQVAS